MHDIIIIGAGPAGLSAAITARARNKDVLVISNKPQDNPLAKSKLIDNYPGLPQISGLRLLEQMVAHAHDVGATFLYERVISVLPMGEHFVVSTGITNNDARAVILATGVQLAKPFVGEAEYLGRGVSYCATCDGMFFRTQTVCVVGMSPDAVEEANFLAELGARVIFLAKKAPKGLDRNIFVKEGTVVEIKGGDGDNDGNGGNGNGNGNGGVTELLFKKRGTDKIESISCSGVFILRPSIAPDALISGLALVDDSIAVDSTMSTNIPGVFAAGDCTNKPLQVAKAVGEGQIACFGAIRYLSQS
jgi:thioredoxin reductase (NADPH)